MIDYIDEQLALAAAKVKLAKNQSKKIDSDLQKAINAALKRTEDMRKRVAKSRTKIKAWNSPQENFDWDQNITSLDLSLPRLDTTVSDLNVALLTLISSVSLMEDAVKLNVQQQNLLRQSTQIKIRMTKRAIINRINQVKRNVASQINSLDLW